MPKHKMTTPSNSCYLCRTMCPEWFYRQHDEHQGIVLSAAPPKHVLTYKVHNTLIPDYPAWHQAT